MIVTRAVKINFGYPDTSLCMHDYHYHACMIIIIMHAWLSKSLYDYPYLQLKLSCKRSMPKNIVNSRSTQCTWHVHSSSADKSKGTPKYKERSWHSRLTVKHANNSLTLKSSQAHITQTSMRYSTAATFYIHFSKFSKFSKILWMLPQKNGTPCNLMLLFPALDTAALSAA